MGSVEAATRLRSVSALGLANSSLTDAPLARRYRDPLPSIATMDREAPEYPSKRLATAANAVTSSSTPMVSPTTTIYGGQPLPYAYSHTTPTTATPTQAGNIRSSQARRASDDDKLSGLAPSHRQSLPSIHEALGGNGTALPYPGPPTSVPQLSQSQLPPPSLPATLSGRASEAPAGPSNPFSNGSLREPVFLPQNGPGAVSQDPSHSSLASIKTHESRNASLQSIASTKSPTQSSRTGNTSMTGSQNSVAYEHNASASAGSVASPSSYAPFPPNYSFQSQQIPSAASAPYTPAPYESRPYHGAQPWKPSPSEQHRTDDPRSGMAGRPAPPGQPHSDSVKRHLDCYDVETSLQDITEVSARTLEFARHYAARAQQTQRHGPILGSLPSLNEVEEILHLQRRNQDALMRLRTAVISQEHALAEQMSQRNPYRTSGEDDRGGSFQEEFKGGGGSVGGSDTKKRRGKAAPPGRCHSCHRAETPEWRRGPDGARTLCNACGLHYAKLTRKFGAQKASSLSSNLKPKSVVETAATVNGR